MTNKMSNKCGHLCQNDSVDEFLQMEMFDKVGPKFVVDQEHFEVHPLLCLALAHPRPVLALTIGLVTQQHKNMSNKCANQAKYVEQMIDRKENVKQRQYGGGVTTKIQKCQTNDQRNTKLSNK